MVVPEHRRPVEILLVEDNPHDVELAEELLKEARISINLSVVQDGIEALEFLRRQGEHADAPRPHLILLDLNLPLKDGDEVLAEIKGDDELLTIPVVVLSTSQAAEDVLRAYRHHANCYIAKPLDLDEFTRALKLIEVFWLGLVKLPKE